MTRVSCAANSQTSFVFLISSYTSLLSHISGFFVRIICQEFRPLKRDVQAPSSVSEGFPLTVTVSINLKFVTKQLSKNFCCYNSLAFTRPNHDIKKQIAFKWLLFFGWILLFASPLAFPLSQPSLPARKEKSLSPAVREQH